MAGGFGFTKPMQRSYNSNRALLNADSKKNQKESYITTKSKTELRFKEFNEEELSVFREKLRKEKKNKQTRTFLMLGSILFLTLLIFYLIIL